MSVIDFILQVLSSSCLYIYSIINSYVLLHIIDKKLKKVPWVEPLSCLYQAYYIPSILRITADRGRGRGLLLVSRLQVGFGSHRLWRLEGNVSIGAWDVYGCMRVQMRVTNEGNKYKTFFISLSQVWG